MQSDKHFTVEFEYQDGTVEVKELDILMLRGIRKDGRRPVYVTITCNRDEHTYTLNPNTIACVRDISYTLDGTSAYLARTRLKPYWFHKLVNKYQG